MACQPSLWSALPPDIGSEQHPRPCRAIEGGLSSQKITVKKRPKNTKGSSTQRWSFWCPCRVKPVLQLGRGMACNAMHMVRGCSTEACCRSGAMNGCWSWSRAVPTRASFSQKCVFRLGHWSSCSLSKTASSALWSCTRDAPLMLWRAWLLAACCWGHVLIGRD